jgi:peroxiredoxin
MTRRGQWVLVGVIVLALVGGLVGATIFFGTDLRQVTVGSAAPQFVARTVDTPPDRRTLSDYRGQVVLLNIWATWCAPCRVEMPSIQRLHDEFKGRGFHVVAVSVDEPGADAAIRDFIKEYGLTFDVWYDPTHRIEQAYQTTGVPQTYVIGRDGVIRQVELGAKRWDAPAKRALIAHLLEEQGG